VDDRYGTPTYVPDLAGAILRLARAPYSGILNFTNRGGATSRYHFIARAAKAAGIDTAGLSGISWRDWKGDKAERPISSALDPSRFIGVTGWTPRTWDEALGAYIATRPGARGTQ